MTNGTAALSIRRVAIDTFREHVAYLHRDCTAVRAEGFQALSKVEVSGNGATILAVLNVVDDECIVGPTELGLSEEAFASLGLPAGHAASLQHAEPPASIAALHRKIAGERLSHDDLHGIIRDIAGMRYTKIELAAFVVAANQFEMDRDEVLHLTDAMIAAGRRLDWRQEVRGGPVVDKHCIGGIPGNRTSMLVVPIVAAHGMLIPKTSSRAITSPAGTADTMELLAHVDLPFERLAQIVRETGGCLAWGGTADLSPADDVLIAVERPLGIDSPGQMVASILSKKIAAGSTHLVLDIPVGPSAKVRSMPEAQRLKKLFEYVATRLQLQIDVVITDGRQPIGRGIGPVLEARDVMQVLENDPGAPMDLRQKALRLALAKMNQIIDAQGRRPFDWHAPAVAPLSFEVAAPADGVVTAIDNLAIARIAQLAGAPKAAGAGIELLCRLGGRVRAGEPLYRVFARFDADLEYARRKAAADPGCRVGEAGELPRDFTAHPNGTES